MAKKTTSALFSALLYIIIGVLLIAFPGSAIGIAMTIAGIVFIISGILEIVKKNIVGGIISLIIGIAIILIGNLIVDIVLLVLGILIAIKGFVDLINAIKKKEKTTVLDILFPALTIVVGLVLAFGNALDVLVIIVGALLVIDGVIGLISSVKKK